MTDDDSPLPKTQNQKARKEPQRLKKPQPPSSGSSFDEKMLFTPFQTDPTTSKVFRMYLDYSVQYVSGSDRPGIRPGKHVGHGEQAQRSNGGLITCFDPQVARNAG